MGGLGSNSLPRVGPRLHFWHPCWLGTLSLPLARSNGHMAPYPVTASADLLARLGFNTLFVCAFHLCFSSATSAYATFIVIVIIVIFRERGRQGKREGEKHRLVAFRALSPPARHQCCFWFLRFPCPPWKLRYALKTSLYLIPNFQVMTDGDFSGTYRTQWHHANTHTHGW